jgi:hypothetical protein
VVEYGIEPFGEERVPDRDSCGGSLGGSKSGKSLWASGNFKGLDQ